MIEMLLHDLGEQIRKKRIIKNLTQSDLALKAGLSRRTVQAIERGESISLENFIAILSVLDMLDTIKSLLVNEVISPLMIAKQKGNTRLRARKSKQSQSEDEYSW